jgi:RNA-directed DNA polymerase
VEQRDPTLQPRALANQTWEEPVSEAKPYDIPKQLVWEAYQRVKANRGSAGVDGVSLAVFELDLKGNLYKIWNRMSSGAYFPPPVRLVEIPKDNGGISREDGIGACGGAVFSPRLLRLSSRPVCA